jgi:hypothetical protein
MPLQIDVAVGGSFTHKTMVEGEALLDRILENSPLLEPIHVEPEQKHEEVSSIEAETNTSIERPSPEPEAQDKDLLYFEDEFFEDFRNISKYGYQKRPPIPTTPLSPDDLRKSIKELTAIMSTKWSQEGESFLKKFGFSPHPQPSSAILVGIWYMRCTTQ